MENVEVIDTTLGELIEALSEEAEKIVPDEKAASQLVAFALSHLLHASNLRPKTSAYWN